MCWAGNDDEEAVEFREVFVEFLPDLGKLNGPLAVEEDAFVAWRLRTFRPHFFAAFAAVLRWDGDGANCVLDFPEEALEGDLFVDVGILDVDGDRGVE